MYLHLKQTDNNKRALIEMVRTFEEDTGLKLTLENFLDHYRLDPRSIYKFASFSRLCARADIIDDFEEPIEEVMSKALSRFALVDSRRWIVFMLRVLTTRPARSAGFGKTSTISTLQNFRI